MSSYRMKKLNSESFEKILMIIFGFLAPAPLISLFSITAYVWGLMIVTIYFLVKKRFRYTKRKQLLIYTGYLATVLISATICFIRMPEEWSNGLITRCIQIIAVFIIYICVESSKNPNLPFWFIKGVFYSAVFQMIWGYCQLVFWHLGYDINTIVFSNLLHMFDGKASQFAVNGSLKISGLCWNSGNFAPLMILGFLLAKNKYVKLSFVFVSLLSGSRTLMIGMIFCVFLYFFKWLFVDKKISQKAACLILAIVLLGGIVLLFNLEYLVNKASSLIASMNVFSNYYTEGSTNTHVMYLLKIPDITVHNSIITNLFGYGPECSGYAYVSHYGFYSQIGQWTVECDYVNILWSYGYLGFCLYYIWLLIGANKCRKQSQIAGIFYLTYLFMGFMYNISFNWMHLTNIMIFVLINKGIDAFSLNMKKESLSNLQAGRSLVVPNQQNVMTTGE